MSYEETKTRGMRCDRCRGNATTSTMSRFNTQTICMPCERTEKAHPAYEAARKAEADAVRAGNYNFKGVGLPPDLVKP